MGDSLVDAVMFAVTVPVGEVRPDGYLTRGPGSGVSLRMVTARRSHACDIRLSVEGGTIDTLIRAEQIALPADVDRICRK